MLSNRLRLRPQLIEGVGRIALRRIFYCGGRIDLEYNATTAVVTMSSSAQPRADGVLGGRLRLPVSFPTGVEFDLPVSFPTGDEVFIACPGALETTSRDAH